MRKWMASAVLAALIAAGGGSAQAATTGRATSKLIIVFKDGHRQAFNLAEIDRVEFSGAASAGDRSAPNLNSPPRGRYIGKWEVGDGTGSTFTITLKENGQALRSLGDMRGKWAYVDGAAEITWDDGWQDAIRRVGSRFQKFAYGAGKKFTDKPDNVTDAHNTSPRPI